MGKTQQPLNRKTDIISASEIGQYRFCSVAWYLQKCGYKPRSSSLTRGAQKHETLGAIVNQVEQSTRRSNALRIVGYLLLIIAILMTITGVITYWPFF